MTNHQPDRQGDGLRALADRFPEVNPGNYDDYDVEALNNWGIEIITAIRATRDAETAPPKPAMREALEAAKAAMLRTRTASIAGCEEGYGKPQLWADELFASHGDLTKAIKLCEVALSSAPVPPADGAGEFEAAFLNLCGALGLQATPLAYLDATAARAALSPSPAVAAEPVAWQPLKREDTLAILNSFRSREDTIDRAADRIEAYVGNTVASALKMIRERYATPPVRGDRETDPILDIIRKYHRDAIGATRMLLEDIAEEVAAVHVPPGAGEREAAGPYEFPYRRTFEALAAAVSLYPSKDAALGINVSVQKFQDAFNSHPDQRALSRQAPHSSREGGR